MCLRKFVVAFGAVVLGVCAASCGNSETASRAAPTLGAVPVSACPVPGNAPLALAVSRRANSPSDLPDAARQIVRRFVTGIPALASGPKLSLINVDGRPSLHRDGVFRSTAGNREALRDDQEQFLAGFDAAAASMRAVEPEVDVLAALEKGAVAAGRPGPGTLVLVDSGLSTTGPLDVSQPGVLDAPADEVVAFLRAKQSLPDLTGITVFLIGIGEVARPQDELGFGAKKRLIERWTGIARAGGAACVTTIDVSRRGDPLDGVKPVKLVPVPPSVVYRPQGRTVLPDAGDVAFQLGQAVFRDPQAAREVLTPVAEQLRANPSYRLLVTGTTARWGSTQYQIDLATRRAQTVKQELVGLGADPARIETRGLGSYFREYVSDNGPGGVLLPGPAQQNRTVRIDPCTPACSFDP